MMMSHHADILDARDPIRGAFFAALALHGAILAVVAVSVWISGHQETFGDKNAGGAAIGIETVDTIPLPHQGEKNPLANETESQVPQTPVKPVERVKEEKVPKDAIPIKSKKEKKPPAQVASERQRFRPYKELEQNQLTMKTAPQVSSPIFGQAPGSGRVGVGPNTTLGTRCGEYAARIQQVIAQKWQTGDVDARIQGAPAVIADFDLLRDGTVRNVRLLQSSGIPSLDFSVQRAILDANPLPPIPNCFDRSIAKAEFTFELKR